MIIIRLDRVLADRKMKLNELAELVGISNVNLSYLKTGKVKAIRFSTLDAICRVLKCDVGDILEFVDDTNIDTDKNINLNKNINQDIYISPNEQGS